MALPTYAPVAHLDAVEGDAAVRTRFGQHRLVIGLLVAVVVLDQATKWWGWRNVPWAVINAGRTWSPGPTPGDWYSGPVTGALLDFLDFGLLCVAVLGLLRRRRPVVVVASGAAMIGGWSSNLLDRLGMHVLTAPGSIRGAVDFIHMGPYYYNVADVVIVASTAVFLGALCTLAGRRRRDRDPSRDVSPPPRPRRRLPRRASLVAVGLAAAMALGVDLALGATRDGKVEASSVSVVSAAHV